MPDVTFVTCASLPELDPDDVLIFEFLRKLGWRCRIAIWSDPGVDWNDTEIVLLRSTWDYHLHAQKFLRWAEERAPRLVNSHSLVAANAHKGYLVDLLKAGVPTIPTALLPRDASQVGEAIRNSPWRNLVVKPAIGLATHGVKRFDLSNEREQAAACDHAASLAVDTDVLIQPYLNSVCEYGERALVFFDGEYSHAVRKTPFQTLAVAGQAGETAVQASDEEIAVANQALASLPEAPVYARVDLVLDEHDQPLVMELELIEPSLFLAFEPKAVERFAAALNGVAAARQFRKGGITAAPGG